MTLIAAGVWIAAAGLFWIFLGYPAGVILVSRLRHEPTPTSPSTHGSVPTVAVVVVAQDEGGRIEGRIQNLLGQEYRAESLSILVASDGSEDDTVERARRWVSPRVSVAEFREPRGKAAVLAETVPHLTADIVVLADSRQRFAPDTVTALVARFADPAVGAVSGELLLVPNVRGNAVSAGVGAYWRYEKAIRQAESRLDSTVGTTGAVWALRRELFEPLAPDTILDDVALPLRIVRAGFRVVFEPGARAYDDAPRVPRSELERKIRTIGGNFQLFAGERWALSPLHNRLWVQTVSHKLLRLTAPALLAILLVGTVALAREPLYGGLASAQVAFYGLALLGRERQRRGLPASIAAMAYAFCLLNWATVRALVRFARGAQSVTWKRRTGPRPV